MTPASIHHTRWSLVQAAKGDTPQGRAALAELCGIYYRPIEAQMHRWLHDAEEASEATQDFFARLLQGGRLEGADAADGRFRNYLFAAARHFTISRLRTQRAGKRGLMLTRPLADAAEEVKDESRAAPDLEFDRAWACALLRRSLEAMDEEQRAQGNEAAWHVLKPWLTGAAIHGGTAAAAAALGISETAVRVRLSRLRQRLRATLEQMIADTLAPGSDFQAELRHLLGLWA